ncbi:hypothetical protein MLD38_034694 [Melastoma candidum]|uniref:Uncharacterized protein n=1 Tax=Melastoma candidum TaxID=119954 RepID=A0ACB9MAR0_9MYRT|nr:hypothetical protein MLD38_034694 [Melastoma candidum]
MASRTPNKPKLAGISDELQKLLDSNMDKAPARRRVREAFKEIQPGLDHVLFKVLVFVLQGERGLLYLVDFFGFV